MHPSSAVSDATRAAGAPTPVRSDWSRSWTTSRSAAVSTPTHLGGSPQGSERTTMAEHVLAIDQGTTSTRAIIRSEEHTSELQSRGHLVCRLLLEKKNSSNSQEDHAR